MSETAFCCFFPSNKRKMRKRTIVSPPDHAGKSSDWGKNDEMLSDMSTFSVKEQKRRLKKAKEEEEKVVKEAERVVQWVKQESARMDVSTINRVLKEDRDGD
ncbi:Pullulanase [Actinidia chinensis var. chinensis]|uniref:Pullulanase n=1 Tax=Actinidia chinensis var. chinensis TaxID=1590841 RepID=A0A2R6PMN5_ACTCC|nr:Pullulanase [Actinidia chinensis var. chinensis]